MLELMATVGIISLECVQLPLSKDGGEECGIAKGRGAIPSCCGAVNNRVHLLSGKMEDEHGIFQGNGIHWSHSIDNLLQKSGSNNRL